MAFYAAPSGSFYGSVSSFGMSSRRSGAPASSYYGTAADFAYSLDQTRSMPFYQHETFSSIGLPHRGSPFVDVSKKPKHMAFESRKERLARFVKKALGVRVKRPVALGGRQRQMMARFAAHDWC